MQKRAFSKNLFNRKFFLICTSWFLPLIVQAKTNYDPNKISQDLHFIHQPSSNDICKGYYEEKTYRNSSEQMKITANTAQLLENNISLLNGNVEAFYSDKYLTSIRAKIYPQDKTKKIKDIELFDDVRLFSDGVIITGRYAKFNLLNNTGVVDKATYRLSLASFNEQLTNSYAYGISEKIIQERENYFNCKDASFTTCTPYINSWSIRGNTLYIDQDEHMAYVKHALFYAGQIPVFYLPYFSFPTTSDRKSGFLYPTFGYSSVLGFNARIPYYFNLSPNYDATIAPEYTDKHGTNFNGEFRHLSKISKTDFNMSFLPYDAPFKKNIGSTISQASLIDSFVPSNKFFQEKANSITHAYLGENRGSVNYKQEFNFNKNLSGKIGIHVVSDDDYLQDFNDSFNTIASNTLPQNVVLNYADPHWRVTTKATVFQTLSPSKRQGTAAPHFILPKINVNTNYRNVFNLFNLANKAEYVNYWSPNKIKLNQWKQIQRFHTKPSVELDLKKEFGFIRPKVAVHMASYNFYNFNSKKKPIDHLDLQKIIPIYTIDSSLIFEKSGQNYKQSLKPRLMYSYIPFSDQSKIPPLNAGYKLISFNNLFEPNRFSGLDRVGDTQQLSYGVSTELIPIDSNSPIASAGIGQIAYFEDRETTICTTKGCSDIKFNGYRSLTDVLSSVAAFMDMKLNRSITWHTDLAYSYRAHALESFKTVFQYKPSLRSIFNFSYSYVINGDSVLPLPKLIPTDDTTTLKQINTSASLPITPHWSFYGGLSYNINSDYFRHNFVGLEYDSCCWAIRFLAGRAYAGISQKKKTTFDNKLCIQFVLKGLGSYGKDEIHSLLKTHIAGFHDHLI